MKITRKNISETRVSLTITLDKKELTKAEEASIVHMGQKVKVAGFRQGKAPLHLIKKQISEEELHSHTLNDAINAAIPEAYADQKLQPLDRPEVEVKKYVPLQEVEFTAEVDILPEVKVTNYKKLDVEKPKVSVLKKDVDEVIERMQKGFADKKEVKRAAKDGDEVVIDFKGFDSKNVAFAGGESKEYPLIIGSKSFIPGFEEALVGKKAGDVFDLPITFPKDYQAAHLAGQKCKFEVKIHSVKELVVPKVDDEFAAKSGPYTDVKQLKDAIKQEITATRQQEADERFKDMLVEKLVTLSKPTAPETLIKEQMKNIETDFTQNLASRGLNLEQYLKDKKMTREEWEKADLYDAAKKRIQSAMVLSEITRLEKVTVDDSEVAARLQQLASQYPDPKMRQQLETPEVKNDLANRIVTEKTLDLLIKYNS